MPPPAAGAASLPLQAASTAATTSASARAGRGWEIVMSRGFTGVDLGLAEGMGKGCAEL